MRAGALLGVALLLAVGGGCGGTGGLSEGGSASSGAPLFVEKCGGCHTLRAAGTQGTIGPNLDDAFAQDRKDGIPDSTIRNVVHDQIRYPSPDKVSSDIPAMPANLVTGEDADSVVDSYGEDPEPFDAEADDAIDAYFRAHGLPLGDHVSDYDQPWYRLMASSYVDRP